MTSSTRIQEEKHERQNGQEKEKENKKRVAIVGSGMAGLVSAYLLRNDRKGRRFDVEVFEMQDRLSLDSASFTVPAPVPAGHDDMCKDYSYHRVDMPMRAFASGYYENLRRMYDYFGVRCISPRFVYALSRYNNDDEGTSTGTTASSSPSTYYVHSSNNHIMPPLRPNGPALSTWILEICYLVICYIWFTTCCFLVAPRGVSPAAAAAAGGKEESFHEYLERIKLPRYYTKNYILPLMSSVTTCTHSDLLAFPAVDIVEYSRRTYGRPHYTIDGGVRQLQDRLVQGKQRQQDCDNDNGDNFKVRFGAMVTKVESGNAPASDDNKVRVSWIDRASEKEREQTSHSSSFDYVIMAVTPNVVGSIFQPLRDAMSAIPTVDVESIVHNDSTRIEDCSKCLQAQLQSSSSPSFSSSSSTTFTKQQPIHICSNSSATESIHEHPASVLVTTFPIKPIDPTKVLHRAKLTRVLRTTESRAVVNGIMGQQQQSCSYRNGFDDEKQQQKQQRLWRNGDGNVFLVGGWCWDGMVMLEGCVVSAIRVADMLGVRVPWM